ncbi:MAG TPA: 50S ribosomal protein L21 [Methylomirabilota bacterium]|jgi:large subunit ribosomal protein L21|nr:50S ribosomal protein L21 [Methylomirabilota bacterium]
MSYAVIRTGGKQYRVSPGELLRVESLPGEANGEITFSEVLLTSIDGAVQVGTPLVQGVTVTARIVQHGKEKKILVFKKKRRKNYRRRRGHRQHFTAVQIKDITVGG